jgi:hypothetical protein
MLWLGMILNPHMSRSSVKLLRYGAGLVLVAWIGIVLWHFPWAVDSPVNREDTERNLCRSVCSRTKYNR